VQQQRQDQQIPRSAVFQSGAKCAPRSSGGSRQFLQVLDGPQRMFVDRVAMIEIAHHQ